MWQCASPNPMSLTGAGGIFETLPFDWTCRAQGFGGEYGRLANVCVGNVLGKKYFGQC